MKDQKINELQTKLVDELINKKFIKTKEVKKALLAVPRQLFLPGVALEKVYSNTAIVTKWDAYFGKNNIVPSQNENLITKKWVNLLFSWD